MDMGSFNLTTTGLNFFLDGEGTDDLRGQFVGFNSEKEILGREPHLLSNLICWSLGAMAVGCRGITVHRPLKRVSGLHPGALTVLHESLDRGAGNFFLERGEQRRLESVYTLEGGKTCGRAGQGIMCIFDKLTAGTRRMGRRRQGILERFPSPVFPLSLSIRLGMESRGETGSGPQQGTKLTPKDGGELATSIRDHDYQDAMETNDMEEY